MYRVLLLITLVLFLGCDSHPPDRPNTLHLPFCSDPPTLDPRKMSDTTSIDIITMCYEGLVRLNPDGKPTMGVAKSIEISPDKKCYTIHLKKTRWSNGWTVTAYDFVETWKTTLSPDFPSTLAYLMYPIVNAEAAKTGKVSVDEVGIKALDKYTIQVNLRHPTPYFTELLSVPSFFPYPERIYEIQKNKGMTVGNGPFNLSRYRFGNYIHFEKNPLYWDQESVKLSDIRIHIIPDHATALNLYEQGDLDWAGLPLNDLPIDAMDSLIGREDYHFLPTTGVYHYVFNTKVFPFNNAKIRKALAIAINREDIVKYITLKGQLPAYALVPQSLSGNDRSLFEGNNIELAKKLFDEGLSELGIKVEDFPSVSLSYNTSECHHKIAQAVQEQWLKTFGVKIKLANKDWKVYLDELRTGQFAIARMGVMASFSDPISLLESFVLEESGHNYSQWTNEVYSETINKAIVEANDDLRLDLLRKAEEILVDQMPVIPIYYYTHCYLKRPYLKNVFITPLGSIDFKWASLEKD